MIGNINLDDPAVSARIRLFVLISAAANLLVLTLTVVLADTITARTATVLICLNVLLLAVLYQLRNSAYAHIFVYLNLSLVSLLIATAGPLSGSISGNSWVLFQVPPLLAAIILDRPRATFAIVIITAAIMAGFITLTLSGTFAARLLVPRASLILNLGFQLVTLAVIGITIALLARRANRAVGEVLSSKEQLQQQLDRVHLLMGEKDQLNDQLHARVAELHERDEQLRREFETQQSLRSTIQKLTTPVVPIMRNVVVMPLVGAIDAAQAAEIGQTLLEGIQRHRARVFVLDVTGVHAIDTAVAQAIMQAAEAGRLLGATPVLVGITPGSAETLVALGIDLGRLVTKADLMAGVEYAVQLTQGQGPARSNSAGRPL